MGRRYTTGMFVPTICVTKENRKARQCAFAHNVPLSFHWALKWYSYVSNMNHTYSTVIINRYSYKRGDYYERGNERTRPDSIDSYQTFVVQIPFQRSSEMEYNVSVLRYHGKQEGSAMCVRTSDHRLKCSDHSCSDQ